jgi:L-cystine uptake protein TcyP (sodium:dicarboxylate symporter family)
MGGIDMILVPVITGLVKATNSLGIPKKYSPIMAIVYGILGGIFYLTPGDLLKGVLYGIVLGLSAVGLYSGTKNFLQNNNDKVS